MSERTALYRYLAADGSRLYIGITGNLKERRSSHANSSWDQQAADFTVEWHDTLDDALAAEFRAIKTEKPKYNRAHNYGDINLADVDWPSLATDRRTKAILLTEFMQTEIDKGRWPVGHRIPGPHELADRVDVGPGTAIAAVKKLVEREYAYTKWSAGYFVRLPSPRSPGEPRRTRLRYFQ